MNCFEIKPTGNSWEPLYEVWTSFLPYTLMGKFWDLDDANKSIARYESVLQAAWWEFMKNKELV